MRRLLHDPVAVTLVLGLLVLAVVTSWPPPSRGGAGSTGSTGAARPPLPEKSPVPLPTLVEPSAVPPPAAAAPDGGVIRLAAVGLARSGGTLVTYGVVLENTSAGWLAFRTGVTVRLLNAAGRILTDHVAKTADVRHTIHAIRPGERFGLGASTSATDSVARVEVVLDRTPTWVPPDRELQPVAGYRYLRLAATTAAEVAFVRTAGGIPAVRYTVTSGFPTGVPAARTFAVYRNAAGTIVGGTALEENPARCTAYPAGRSGYVREVSAVPADADPARTEVFVNPYACWSPR